MIIDQDCAGPGGTDMQAVLALVNSQETLVLGITVVTDDDWRDEEVQPELRLLEIIGRTDIAVVPGAVFPMVNTKEATARWDSYLEKWFTRARGITGSRCTVRGKFLRCRKVRRRRSPRIKTRRIF